MLKKFKKAGAILLSALFTAAIVPSMAFAAATCSITINNTNDNHTYTAYQVFGGVVDSTGAKLSEVEWGSGIRSASLLEDIEDSAADFYGKFNDVDQDTKAYELAEMIETLNNTQLKAFAGFAAENTRGSGSTGALTGSSYVISGLEPGYYIIVDTLRSGTTNEAVSRYMLQVAGDVSVEPKASVPTIDKKVFNPDQEAYMYGADGGIGDTVSFKIEAVLPDNLSDYNDYTFIICDQMSEELTFNEIELVSLNDATLSDRFYSFSGPDNDNKFTVTIDVGGREMSSGSVIVFYYNAIINSKAKAGTPITNKASLIYSNDPNSSGATGTTDPDDNVCSVYTYRMDLKKVAEGTSTGLKDAGFVFGFEYYPVNLINDTYVQSEDPEQVYAVIENGKFKSWTLDETEASVMTTNELGLISLDGIDDGEFFLKEVRHPDGFNLLKEPVNIVIRGDQNAAGGMESLSVTSSCADRIDTEVSADKSTGIIQLIVENIEGSAIPVTGGEGTAAIMLSGLFLVLCAAGLMLTRRRKIEK